MIRPYDNRIKRRNQSTRLAEFFGDPQRFMDSVTNILKHELHRLLVPMTFVVFARPPHARVIVFVAMARGSTHAKT